MGVANNLKVGFNRVDITPPMGISVEGYFVDRYADGVLDNIELNTLALSDGKNCVLLLSMDNCEIRADILMEYRFAISKKTGVPVQAIFIHTTHTHTGPSVKRSDDKLINEYRVVLCEKCVKSSVQAINDLKNAKMGYAVGCAPNIAFIRRFIMKDGSFMTNPGVNNPDIVKPIGDIDERVGVLRFDRENASSVVLVNFGNHPDTVGGNKISGDWPAFTRKFVERAIENTDCIFFNGAEGDVNHVNVKPKKGDFNDLKEDFDGCSRGYGHARHMGRVVAGAVMQVYDKANYIDVDCIKFAQTIAKIPSNMPTEQELVVARKYNDLHKAGRDDLIPYDAMMLTTVVAEAQRMVDLEFGPQNFELEIGAVKLGDVAFVTIPGEPFNGIGLALKDNADYGLVIPCCLTNGAEGYFPMREAYEQGGYEARSSIFKVGVAEIIIDEGKKLLQNLK